MGCDTLLLADGSPLAHVQIDVESRASGGTPVLFLGGGPGLPAIPLMAGLAGPVAALTDASSVVTIDYPASGRSGGVHCPRAALERDTLMFSAREVRNVIAIAREFALRCGEASESAAQGTGSIDRTVGALVQLRQELGIERWDVVAQSYGTRVAMSYVEQDARHIGRFILDAPIEAKSTVETWALRGRMFGDLVQATLEWCANDGECRSRFVDRPTTVYESVVADLTLMTGERLGPIGFSVIVAGLVQDPEGRGRFLGLLARAERLGVGWLDETLRADADIAQPDGPDAFSDAAYYEAECRDWSWPTADAEERAKLLVAAVTDISTTGVVLRDLPCAFWPVESKSPEQPMAVRAPTVVLRSTLDWAAPLDLPLPSWQPGQTIVIDVEGGPHGNIGWQESCVVAATRAAFAGTGPTRTTCAVPLVSDLAD